MDIKELYYFKAFAELENITKAAGQLYISQPALTKAIHKFENELHILYLTETASKST